MGTSKAGNVKRSERSGVAVSEGIGGMFAPERKENAAMSGFHR